MTVNTIAASLLDDASINQQDSPASLLMRYKRPYDASNGHYHQDKQSLIKSDGVHRFQDKTRSTGKTILN